MQFEYEDKVMVFWTGGKLLQGTIKHIPNDVGDTWHILDTQGNLHAINPNCSDFEEIIKFKQELEQGGVE